ncbi:MAG TPA: amidohydrolase family protein [candidate division Zixibacteria bacterium]|nr:amidohydrolase family protein [candidate division Zixibacteria bacterium]
MAAANGHGEGIEGVIISSDSHVMEPVDLWKKGVPERYRDAAPLFPPHKVGEGFQHHPGGWDPNARIKEMEADGVSAEVLYPTLLLDLFALDDAGLQEACFRVYNDWLIDYCSVDTNRLIGVSAIPVYDIDVAVKELERCRKAGLRGAMVWQVPHPSLPFRSDHYDKFWAAAQDLDVPVSLHILTGHGYNKDKERRKGVEHYRGSVNLKLADIAGALFEFIFYGILERYPRLRVVTVENEVGWLPFMVQQWDYYYRRFRGVNPPPITRDPSEFVRNQVYSCFFNDAVCGHNLEWWGQDNVMWSNDFPHPNSTWPNSLRIIRRDLGHLPVETQTKVLATNVARLYDLDLSRIPAGIARAAARAQASA